MPIWIFIFVPVLFLSLLIRKLLAIYATEHVISADVLISTPIVGLFLLFVGSAFPIALILGGNLGLIRSLRERFVEPWGYFGYLPVSIITIFFLSLGVYFLAKSK